MTEYSKAADALLKWAEEYPDAMSKLGTAWIEDTVSDLYGLHNREIEGQIFDGTLKVKTDQGQSWITRGDA